MSAEVETKKADAAVEENPKTPPAEEEKKEDAPAEEVKSPKGKGRGKKAGTPKKETPKKETPKKEAGSKRKESPAASSAAHTMETRTRKKAREAVDMVTGVTQRATVCTPHPICFSSTVSSSPGVNSCYSMLFSLFFINISYNFTG